MGSYSASFFVAMHFFKHVLGAFSFFVAVLIRLSKKLTFETMVPRPYFFGTNSPFKENILFSLKFDMQCTHLMSPAAVFFSCNDIVTQGVALKH